MSFDLSEKLFAEASKHLIGGVNSPVRAFKSVGGVPPFIMRGKGAEVWDADGNEYIDYVGSYGPAILGHAPGQVLQAIHEAMKEGLSFGAPTPREIQLAQDVKGAFPAMERVRFVNSGTEATMSAIRLARGFTGREQIIKFDGCYHGHADSLLVQAGSGAETLGVPDSAGVPQNFAKTTSVARYNSLSSVEEIFSKQKVAAIILEPIVGNMGLILPQPGFLKGLQDLAKKHGALVIIDEVMTGFRVNYGGACALYGLTPDLVCLGKIIGGGLPVGAYGGRAEIMEKLAPMGPVYQAGTLSGNPLAMNAGIATLKELQKKGFYEALEAKGDFLEKGILALSKKHSLPLQFNRVGSMWSVFFSEKPVVDADSARASDKAKFTKVFHHLLKNGIYLAPSPFEAAFISSAHTFDHLEKTIRAFDSAFQIL